MRVVSRCRDAEEESEVALDRTHLAEPAERICGEVRVAGPAVAVVPGAAGVGSFRDRGRHRRDDSARSLVHVQLQRDRRADHRVAPFARSSEGARPIPPIRCGSFEHRGAFAGHVAPTRDGIVESEHQSDGFVDMEQRPVDDRLCRSVGGEPERLIASVADVTGPERVLAFRATVVGCGFDANADVRPSPDRPHLAHQQLGTKQCTVLLEAWAEIGDLDAAALRVVEARDEYRRVGEVLLLGSDRPLQLDGERADFVARRVAREQRAKNRVAIETWEAAPRDGALSVYQCADAAVAEEREVERGHSLVRREQVGSITHTINRQPHAPQPKLAGMRVWLQPLSGGKLGQSTFWIAFVSALSLIADSVRATGQQPHDATKGSSVRRRRSSRVLQSGGT